MLHNFLFESLFLLHIPLLLPTPKGKAITHWTGTWSDRLIPESTTAYLITLQYKERLINNNTTWDSASENFPPFSPEIHYQELSLILIAHCPPALCACMYVLWVTLFTINKDGLIHFDSLIVWLVGFSIDWLTDSFIHSFIDFRHYKIYTLTSPPKSLVLTLKRPSNRASSSITIVTLLAQFHFLVQRRWRSIDWQHMTNTVSGQFLLVSRRVMNNCKLADRSSTFHTNGVLI